MRGVDVHAFQYAFNAWADGLVSLSRSSPRFLSPPRLMAKRGLYPLGQVLLADSRSLGLAVQACKNISYLSIGVNKLK
jgi:hypothetical protein